MQSFMTIVRFTFMNRLKSKTFIVVSVIFMLIITGLFNIPRLFSMLDSDAEHKVENIGILHAAPQISSGLISYYEDQASPDYRIVDLGEADEQAARRMIADGEIIGYLLFDGNAEALPEAFPSAVYKSRSAMEINVLVSLQEALTSVKQQMAIAELDLPQEQLERLFSPVSLASEQISIHDEAGRSEEEVMAAYVLVYVMILFLYLAVILYGQMIATEITAEKSSRVMEVLISSVAPLKQLAGKLVGTCLLGLVQLLFFVLVFIVNLYATPGGLDFLSSLGVDLSQLSTELFMYFLIFYLLGYFTYGTLSAAIGSIVSRTEELNQALTPIMVLIIVAFFLAFNGIQEPNTPMITLTSYIPFLAPLIMFVRIGMSDPAQWEIWLSIAIQLAAIGGLSWLSAKIYRTGVLMYGKRPSLRELWKAMRSYGI